MLSISISGLSDSILKSTTPELLAKDIDLIVCNTPELDTDESNAFIFFSPYCSPIGAEETVMVLITCVINDKMNKDFIKTFVSRIGKRVSMYLPGFRVGCVISPISGYQVWSSEEDIEE